MLSDPIRPGATLQREALVRLVRAPDAILELAIAFGQLHRHHVRSVRRPDGSVVMKVTYWVTNFEFVGHCGLP
jgi:hypothetical protein